MRRCRARRYRVVAGRRARLIPRGYRFIVLGSDAGLIAGAAQRTVQAIRI
jgi:2-keto-3-deoxy-L-rhamnonate aldolase RhmA